MRRDRISTEAGVAGPGAVPVVTDSQGETAYLDGADGLLRL
jgi:hypothetical protein